MSNIPEGGNTVPYRSIDQLPKAQTDQYSEHQKTAFRKTFNDCYGSGKYKESECFAIAHASAKKAPKRKP